MEYQDTVASQCRYGDVAKRIFGDAEIIWEHSENDCQGSANLLALLPDGRFVHYEWTYGSCSGCDEWEERFGWDADDKIEKEMRESANYFDSVEVLMRYLKLEDKDANIPTAQSSTAGSIPGMLRYLSGGILTEFQEMGEAFRKWQESRDA